jgi:hypothetical protein
VELRGAGALPLSALAAFGVFRRFHKVMSFQFPAARITDLAALADNADKAVIISPLTE